MFRFEVFGISFEIGSGHHNPVKRSGSSNKDRKIRKEIEDMNNHGWVVINVGQGYYIPYPGDPVDVKEYNEYIRKEKARARKIQKKILAMQLAWQKRCEEYENEGKDSA